MEMLSSLHKDGDRISIHGYLLCSAGGSGLECVRELTAIFPQSVISFWLQVVHSAPASSTGNSSNKGRTFGALATGFNSLGSTFNMLQNQVNRVVSGQYLVVSCGFFLHFTAEGYVFPLRYFWRWEVSVCYFQVVTGFNGCWIGGFEDRGSFQES